MGVEDLFKQSRDRARRIVGGGRDQALRIDGVAPRVRDAKGKVLELGDEVLIVAPTHEFRVAQIQPLNAPGAPPNLMEVLLVTKLAIVVPRDQSVESLYQLRHAAQIKDNPFAPAPPDHPNTPSADPTK